MKDALLSHLLWKLGVDTFEEACTKIDEIREIEAQGPTDLKTLLRGLSPPLLDGGGQSPLNIALLWHVVYHSPGHKVVINFSELRQLDGDPSQGTRAYHVEKDVANEKYTIHATKELQSTATVIKDDKTE